MEKEEEKKKEEAGAEWVKQTLPNIYLQFENILYQTAWVLKQEIKRQEKQAKKAQTLFEQEMSNHPEFRKNTSK